MRALRSRDRLKFLGRARALLRGPNIYWILTIVSALLLNYGWDQLTRTRGAQKVDFLASEEKCAATGELRYCVYRDRRGTNGDIVYHLHGRNLDERIWNDPTYFTALIQSEWQRVNPLPPMVVTVSYGPTWLLTPKGEKSKSGLLDDFMDRLESIEAQIGTPRRRMLMGESMGGLNVLISGLSYPEKFEKIASLCPGVYAVSPFESFSAMNAAVQRTGANPKTAFGIFVMARTYFASEQEWNSASPLSLIRGAGPDYPELYLSNGLYDAFGNYEGTQQLASAAIDRGVKTEWRPLYGGHCAIDASSLATFLLR